MRFLADPSCLFVLIWGGLISLFSLHVLNINVPYDWRAMFVVFSNIILALGLFVLSNSKQKKFDVVGITHQFLLKRRVVKAYVHALFFLYFTISVIDVVYSGGVPLVWKLTGDSRQYVDFGMPTLHGIANSIIYFLSTLCTLLWCLGVWRAKAVLFLIIIWQFIIFSRGTVMVMMIQMLSVCFFMSRFTFGKVLFLMLFGAFVVFMFGVVGDLRHGYNPYYQLLQPEWVDFFDFVPSGVLWFYVYFVSGFNNFLFNAALIDPSYFPIYTFAKLVPSVVYNLIGVEKAVDSFEFVNSGLNVSTIYSGFYSDFGMFSFVPVFIVQLIASVFYVRARSGSVHALLAYSVCYQAIMFSPFIDTFFYLPFIAQFLIVWHFKRVFGNASAKF